jgi:hypothetical protein
LEQWKNSRGFRLAVIFLLAVQFVAIAGIIIFLAAPGQDRPADSRLAYTRAESGKYILYIGTNDKDTYTPLLSLEEAKEKIGAICRRHVSGYTVQEAAGGWTDETGAFTSEQTLIYSFSDAREADIIAIMDEVLAELNQNSILVEHQDLTYCYYSGT